MKTIYKTNELDQLEVVQDYSQGVWVNLADPTIEEIREVAEALSIDTQDIMSALDEEERAHVDNADDYILILVDVPYKDKDSGFNGYGTIPLEIILGDKFIVTVCLRELQLLEQFTTGKMKKFYTYKKTRFILQILYKNASYYLQYLRSIDRSSELISHKLHQSTKNKELIQLLDLDKSLVYLSTSLRANEMVLEKMMRMDSIKQYPEDKDLLEDVIIENKQAIEMANIYSSILNGTMNAFASVISNNLNIAMKTLTSITIILSIPTMIFSFYGMNVDLPFQGLHSAYWGILGISVATIGIIALTMFRKKLF